jgi:hypothetical protein
LYAKTNANRELARLSSESVPGASAELTFYRMIGAQDGLGRLPGEPRPLLALLYPVQPKVTEAMLETWLGEVAALVDADGEALVLWYEVEGQRYVQLVKYRDYQRNRNDWDAKSAYPAPSGWESEVDSDTVRYPNGVRTAHLRMLDRVDREIEKAVRTSDSPPPSEPTETEREILRTLKAVAAYAFDYARDLEHIRALAVDFPAVDLLAQAKAWRTYKLDKPLLKRSNPRSQFRNWCANALRYSTPKEGPPAYDYSRDPGFERGA